MLSEIERDHEVRDLRRRLAWKKAEIQQVLQMPKTRQASIEFAPV